MSAADDLGGALMGAWRLDEFPSSAQAREHDVEHPRSR
jgi:hypothetical protein